MQMLHGLTHNVFKQRWLKQKISKHKNMLNICTLSHSQSFQTMLAANTSRMKIGHHKNMLNICTWSHSQSFQTMLAAHASGRKISNQ
jgi:hypothetical protein